MTLNEEQTKVVNAQDQHLFLLAGAGSGKTRVIVERVKKIIEQTNQPHKILCITFTRKSAHEMRTRINNGEVRVHTFHQLAFQSLKEIRDFKVLEEHALARMKSEFKPYSEQLILSISVYKNSLSTSKKPKYYDQYQAYLDENKLLDFDDLLRLYLEVCQSHEFDYIFVDEFQDTNLLQYELLKKMNKPRVKTFCVGDPDQSIYRFRGSDFKIIYRYIDEFQATLYKLEQNYRSAQSVLDGANHLISYNKFRIKKELKTKSALTGQSVIILEADQSNRNQLILSIIKQHSKAEIGILYRCNFQAIKLSNFLHQHYCFNQSLLTFHESKGLEFDIVIILDAHLLPFEKENTFSSYEEERRLFFVGMTRAREKLLIFASKRNQFLDQTNLLYETASTYLK